MTKPPTPRIKAPKSGVRVRMYRQGHGDCFLLTFRRSRGTKPFFMLIDCGRKKGSTPADLTEKDIDMEALINALWDDTGGKLDVVVVTHEHEDHVSGFPKVGDDTHPFSRFHVEDLWLAWTEDGTDEDANRYRELYGDKLLTLALAHEKLRAFKGVGAPEGVADEIAEFLELETGHRTGAAVLKEACIEMGVAPRDISAGPEQAFAAARNTKIRGKRYKERLAGLRTMVKGEIKFLSPGDAPLPLKGVKGVRVFPFGPPRDQKLLTSLNPRKAEEFRVGPFAMGDAGAGLLAAFEGGRKGATSSPFAPRYVIRQKEITDSVVEDAAPERAYLSMTYLAEEDADRRIDGDWMGAAEALALRLNSEVNNTSLVLAFELEKSGRTLLFTGDAQRGSWISWAKLSWDVDGQTVTAKDLLARCTFYKAGHHGSHNATLNGTLDSPHPNLSWMAQGVFAPDFVAMVPANKTWAWGKTRPWRHPMKAIEQALIEKARSRVLMIEPHEPERHDAHSGPEFDDMWDAFVKVTKAEDFAIEHVVEDTEPLRDTT
jgi:beta-lactamase superfamily II metal-dependent hydrolase